VPENLDDGHLDWYFFLLAGLMGLTMVYFYYISRDYHYKTDRELSIFDNDDEGGIDPGSTPLANTVENTESEHHKASEEDVLADHFGANSGPVAAQKSLSLRSLSRKESTDDGENRPYSNHRENLKDAFYEGYR
jgi:hypothetical protein